MKIMSRNLNCQL